MSSPIDCSSTGVSSGASSPTSDGPDGWQSAASTTAHETNIHDGRGHDGHGSESPGNSNHICIVNRNQCTGNHGNRNHGNPNHDDPNHDDPNHDNRNHDSEECDCEECDCEECDCEEHDGEEHINETINGIAVDRAIDEEDIGEGNTDDGVIDEENIDEETVDEHTDDESTDNEEIGHEEVQVGTLPRDDDPRRGPLARFLFLIPCLFVVAAVIYSAREPLPAYLIEPPQLPAWLTDLQLPRPEVLVPLDVAASVRAIVEGYKPFMGDDVGLLAARPWPCGEAPLLMRRAIPGADFEGLGGTLAFFDDMSRNVTEFCTTIEDTYSTPAGDTLRPNKDIEGLCRPLVNLCRSASRAYIKVAYGLAGPDQDIRWLQQVRTEVLDLAIAAAGLPGDAGHGHTVEDGADYPASNASTSERIRGHIGRRGSWQATNLRFRGPLLSLHGSCVELEVAWLALAPVARSFVAGMRASAAHDAAAGPLQTQVVGDLLQLESAMKVVQELALAAEDGVKALAMAQFRLQELHEKLGCVKRACFMARHADDGREARAQFTLADRSVLRDMLTGTAVWLEAQISGSHSGDN